MVESGCGRVINIAIVGAGKIGKRHATHASVFGRLVAVCDTDMRRAMDIKEEHHCNAYSDFDSMLEHEPELDLVAVCTPNGFHAEHTVKSLDAGINVLCEKPMAITVRDCERMIHAAEKANKRLFVVKQNRFNPPVVALKNVIADGTLGNILSVHVSCFWNRHHQYYKESAWRGTKAMDGGILFTQFSHFIDLLYWLVGDIKSIKGYKNNLLHRHVIDFEDQGALCFIFYNGVVGSLHYTINSYGGNMEGSLTIFCSKGTVKIGGQYLNVIEYQNVEGDKLPSVASTGCNDYGEYQGSMSNHDKVYENVVNVLAESGTIMTDALDGLKTVQIIERIEWQK